MDIAKSDTERDVTEGDAWAAEYERAERTYGLAKQRADQAIAAFGTPDRDLLERFRRARPRVRFLARLGQMTPAARAVHLG